MMITVKTYLDKECLQLILILVLKYINQQSIKLLPLQLQSKHKKLTF